MPCEPIDSMKNRPRRSRNGRRGFTLLEILVALFILTIIMSLIFGSFEGVFSNADHMNAASDLYEMGTAGLSRITRDLEAIHVMTYPRYHPPDIDDEPDIYRVSGAIEPIGGHTFSKLRFTSMAHLPLNQDRREGIAQIVYYVQEEDDNSLVLRRADRLYPYPDFEPTPSDPVLCEQIRAFQLVFYSAQGDEQEEWDSDSDDVEYSTPKSIAIKLSIGDPESPLEFMTEVALPLYRFKEDNE